MLELSLLRHFVALARARSFTGAARELQASQPVISRSIQRLEDIVGTPLVERSTRSVKLTAAGEALLSDAEYLLGRAAVALENTRRIGQGNQSRIRVGICPSTESPELAHGIAAFRSEWPQVNLSFASIDGAALPDALRTSEVDVAIMQMDSMHLEGITAKIIATYGLAVAVPAIWGYDSDQTVSLIELKDRPWLMPQRQRAPAWHDSLIEMCRKAGFEPNIVGTVDDPLSARLMIASGAGATFFHDKGRRDWHEAIQLLQFTDRQIPPPSRTAAAHAEGANSPQIVTLIICLANAHATPAERYQAIE